MSKDYWALAETNMASPDDDQALTSEIDSFLNFKPTVQFYISNTVSIFFNVNIDYEILNATTTDYSSKDEELFHSNVGLFTIWLFVILSVVVLVIGLVGNCLVWFAVWRNPRMRSATNIFLVNLAVADFLVILICLPPTMAEDVTGIWYLGKEMCKIVKCLQVRAYLRSPCCVAITVPRLPLSLCPLRFLSSSTEIGVK